MYEETIAYPNKGKISGFLLVLGLFALVLLMSVLSALLRQMNVPYADYVFFLIIIGLAFLVFKQRIYKYRFVAGEKKLFAYRLIGTREKLLAELSYESMLGLMPYDSSDQIKALSCDVWTGKLVKMQLVYMQGTEKQKLVFQPGEGLQRHILDGINGEKPAQENADA